MVEVTGSGIPIIVGYRNMTRIGRGGFSFVYKAEQISLGREVAIKILLTDLADEAEVRRFTNECQILGRLGAHRNIVDVHDAGLTEDGRPYIVMKFYSRGSLADRIKTEGPMPAREVISVGIKMATALLAAHEIGVIHRDVKPDNILVDDNGEPILTDFGVAAVADASGRFTSSIAFSHAHVAPEVLDGNDFGPLSDIYSLGSTLYTLLTGRAAFAADTEVRQIMAIMHAEPPPIDIPRVPPQLVDVIMKAMSKARGDRFVDAGAMATALEQIAYPIRTAGNDDAGLVSPISAAGVAGVASAAVADAEATRIRPSTQPPAVLPVEAAPKSPVPAAQVANGANSDDASAATVIRPSTQPPVVVSVIAQSAPPKVEAKTEGAGSARTAVTPGPARQQPHPAQARASAKAGASASQASPVKPKTPPNPPKVASAPPATSTPLGKVPPPPKSPPKAGTATSLGGPKSGSFVEMYRWPLLAGGIFLILVVAGGAMALVMQVNHHSTNAGSLSSNSSVGQTVVPTVTGLQLDAAKRQLTVAGYAYNVIQQSAGTDAAGTVLAQSPIAGVSLASGSTVTLTVASAPSAPPPPTAADQFSALKAQEGKGLVWSQPISIGSRSMAVHVTNSDVVVYTTDKLGTWSELTSRGAPTGSNGKSDSITAARVSAVRLSGAPGLSFLTSIKMKSDGYWYGSVVTRNSQLPIISSHGKTYAWEQDLSVNSSGRLYQPYRNSPDAERYFKFNSSGELVST